ncbi:MAG: hypothetical protein IKO72_02985 [Kiritimatiellae bacterium]|nr:hypothetical protein [Kiritimatiellia bacterium]
MVIRGVPFEEKFERAVRVRQRTGEDFDQVGGEAHVVIGAPVKRHGVKLQPTRQLGT